MSELDTRLDQAVQDLRDAVAQFELAPLPQRRRARAPGVLAVVASAVAVVLAMAVFATRSDTSSGDRTDDGASPPRADDQLAADVVEIASVHGWEVTVGTGRDARQASATASGGGYVEVRARLNDSSDTLLVSVRVDDREAAAAGSDGRAGLLRTVGTASVYVGTDSRAARAVELFNGTTIVYVRFESGTDSAPSLETLSDVAVAVDDVWRTRDVAYPPAGPGVELLASTPPERDE